MVSIGNRKAYFVYFTTWTTELVESYLPEDYKRDLEGFTVISSIHVEVVWPGDPAGETRYVGLWAWIVLKPSVGLLGYIQGGVEGIVVLFLVVVLVLLFWGGGLIIMNNTVKRSDFLNAQGVHGLVIVFWDAIIIYSYLHTVYCPHTVTLPATYPEPITLEFASLLYCLFPFCIACCLKV